MEARESGDSLTDENLLGEIFTLLFAGHETTSTTLAWTIEKILAHPDILVRIEEEIDHVIGRVPVERSHLPKLKYLEAVIQEGHRMSRRTPFTGLRLVKEPFQIGDFTLPKGQIIAICHHAMCHREDTFPNPLRFNPERFIRQETKGVEFSPYGRGIRACAGRVFAQVELKVILATLFQKARLELVSPTQKAIRLGFMFGPGNGLQVMLKKRQG